VCRKGRFHSLINLYLGTRLENLISDLFDRLPSNYLKFLLGRILISINIIQIEITGVFSATPNRIFATALQPKIAEFKKNKS
jgi:hypothetical protein